MSQTWPILRKNKTHPVMVGLVNLVDLVGLEPTAFSMPLRRAPSCATGPFFGLMPAGGAEGIRTPDLYSAIVALSQLRYSPDRPGNCTLANSFVKHGRSVIMARMDTKANAQTKVDPKKRSRIPPLLGMGFGCMALVNLGRALQSYWNVNLLAGREASLSPWVWLALSRLWAAVFLAAGWGLWLRRGWSRQLSLALPPIYGLDSVGMTWLFSQSPYARGRWGLTALGWLLVSLLVAWLLTRKRVRREFGNPP